MKINLYDKRWGKNEWSSLDLVIEEDKITFDGVDAGDSVKEAWGDSDYEFWRTYKSDQFGKMLGHLIKECFEREIFTRESQFESWCEERGIKSSFQSYV